MTKFYFVGYNGFKQFKNCDELMMSDITEWTTETDVQNDTTEIKFCSSWSVNVVAHSNCLLLSGCLNGLFGQSEKITLPSKIKEISCNDSFCLILLNNGHCYKLIFDTLQLCELNFLSVDQPTNNPLLFNTATSDVSQPKKSNADVIEHIACAHTFSVAVTNTNAVYNIPSRIYVFPKHVKVKKIYCGAEHALLLTTNGDVYSWGSSSRGQLGLGQLDSEFVPTLIEALAGIKITDISAGLWHSAAVSAFGDLYMWGWNLNGQMGKPIYKDVKINFESGRSDVVRHKDASVFASPEIIDLPIPRMDGADEIDSVEDQFSIERVHCGSRHTVLETTCGKILGCGFNRYGQVGKKDVDIVDDNIVQFVEINNHFINRIKVTCGSWCTIFITE